MLENKDQKIVSLISSIEGLHNLAEAEQGASLNRPGLNRYERGAETQQFSSHTVPNKASQSKMDSDFDEKLAKLIDDVVGQKEDGVSSSAAIPPVLPQKHAQSPSARKPPYLEPLRPDQPDIRAEIDALLAPYIEKEKAGPTPFAHDQDRQVNTPSAGPKLVSQPSVSAKQANTPSGQHPFNALLTPEVRQELNLFIKEEIKKQISAWVAQNIHLIIEDTLLSSRSEARNASVRTRDASKSSG